MHWCMQTRLQMLALLTMVLAVIDADDAVADADDADDDAEAVMVLGCRGNWVWLVRRELQMLGSALVVAVEIWLTAMDAVAATLLRLLLRVCRGLPTNETYRLSTTSSSEESIG